MQLTTVVYAGKDGSVANVHFMPTAFIPHDVSWLFSERAVTSFVTSVRPGTGATVAFPNLYADIKGIPWLYGGTAWAGTRYYKRESIYISDFFYWNPSGVGAGIEDINLGRDLRLSYAAFAVDGQPSGIARNCRRELISAFETICSFEGSSRTRVARSRSDFSTSRTTATTRMLSAIPLRTADGASLCEHVQELLGGDNKLVFQYGKGGGTGFGTLVAVLLPRLLSSLGSQGVTTARSRCADHSADRVVRHPGGLGLPAGRHGYGR